MGISQGQHWQAEALMHSPVETDYQKSMVRSTPERPHCRTLDLGSPAPPTAEETETEGCLCPGLSKNP